MQFLFDLFNQTVAIIINCPDLFMSMPDTQMRECAPKKNAEEVQMEPRGFEPLTSSMPLRRSTN